ncbi:putative quinol monooxygenase [Pseudonocardia thermophila]|uniref:putative quinol monooxygenase n=1 Tax=Pseudonocardia thermophila TaxID=1848 RepID=UPI00248E5E28|nr:putative quinol monooxygenase [Pseudonocardia thermophila]
MGFVVIATWTAAEGKADHIRSIIEELTPHNRAEPKMIHFEAHVSTEDPHTFVLYEHYTDATGYDDHRATARFQQRVLGDALPALVARQVKTYFTLG